MKMKQSGFEVDVTKSHRYRITSVVLASIFAVPALSFGWVGVDLKPLEKPRSELAFGESGSYFQLSDNERKELVWMVKAANAAYPSVGKPLGYRSFSREEWDACAAGCDGIVYTEDGYFNVGSGLRGRLMVNMLNEGRVVLALSGCDLDLNTVGDGLKDVSQCIEQYFTCTAQQYEQALKIVNGILASKPRTDLWIVGHSLGGSLTTYLALNLPESKTNVKCATFNGFGLSPRFHTRTENARLATQRLRNVYCEGDLVYNNRISIGARHWGPSYSVECQGNWLEQHSIDKLVKLMVDGRTKWAGL